MTCKDSTAGVSFLLNSAWTSAGAGKGIDLAAEPDPDPAPLLAGDDRAAFERIVEAYQPRVTRLARRVLGWADDVEDIVQDVFLAVWRHRKGFRGTFGQKSFEAWLTRITINQCRSHRRRRWLRWARQQPLEDVDAIASDDPKLDRETFAQVRAAIRSLKPADREVIVLHYLEQMPIARIAETLGLRRNTVEVRLHRARQRLRAMLDGILED